MNNFLINTKKFENGWLYIEIINDKTICLIASYVYDTPLFLLKSINNLYKNSIKEKVLWEAEIDCSYLVLTIKDDFIEVMVEYDNKEDLLSLDKKQKKNEIIFLSKCSLFEFSNKIFDLFNKLLNTYGEEKYKEIWSSPFPKSDLNELGQNIGK